MIFGPNDSPLAGREGTQLTGSKIGERLNAEAETSVSLRVLPVDGGGESFEVQARGELQLGLLIGLCPQKLCVFIAFCCCHLHLRIVCCPFAVVEDGVDMPSVKSYKLKSPQR